MPLAASHSAGGSAGPNATLIVDDRRKRQHAVAGLCLDDEGGDPRTVFLRSQRDFAHASCRARRVIHRGAQQFGEGKRLIR